MDLAACFALPLTGRNRINYLHKNGGACILVLEFAKEAAVEERGVVGNGASEEASGTLDDVARPSVAGTGVAGEHYFLKLTLLAKSDRLAAFVHEWRLVDAHLATQSAAAHVPLVDTTDLALGVINTLEEFLLLLS